MPKTIADSITTGDPFAEVIWTAAEHLLDFNDRSNFTLAPHHEEEVAKASARLAELETIDPAEADRRAIEHVQRANELGDKYSEESRRKVEMLDRFLSDLAAWQPPSQAHGELKEFVARRANEERDRELRSREWTKPCPPMTGAEWLDQAMIETRRVLAFYRNAIERDIVRVARNIDFRNALQGALPRPVSPV